jgi:antitoxin (DNA-binding transcriptional repressor) of toxin-antitoxin stability system
MGTTVNIHEAKTQLSKLLRRVQDGEEIVIAKAGKPIARLSRFPDRPPDRVPGMDKGKVVIHPDFDDPLPEFDGDYMHPGDPMRELLK